MNSSCILTRISLSFLAVSSFALAANSPTITSISGTSGTAGGGLITIEGLSFGPSDAIVTFDSATAEINSQNDTTIVCVAPEGEGTVSVVVISQAQLSSNSGNFSYNAPTLIELSPLKGLAVEGSQITITGTNFGLNPAVTFDSLEATIISNNHTSITVEKPATSSGTNAVAVSVGGQSTAETLNFSSVDLTCLPGYYIDLENELILPAPAGRYTDTANATTTIEAPIGHYCPIAGMRAAIPASPGYFVANPGAMEQTAAPLGCFTSKSGANATTLADPGTYCPVEGMRAAIPASPGYFVADAGAMEQTAAPLGRFTSNSGANATTLAEPGTYCPIAGMRAAIPASPGYFVANPGAMEQTPAPLGRYVSSAASNIAIPAPAGTYAPVLGLRAAIPAPDGTYAPDAQSTSVTRIPAGFMSSGEGASTVTALPQIEVTAYGLESDGKHTLQFSTDLTQSYGIYYTENLQNYVLVDQVAGTGFPISRTVSAPESATTRGFFVVAPAATP